VNQRGRMETAEVSSVSISKMPGSAAEADGVDVEKVKAHLTLEEDEHQHYSQRAPWLRAGVLGALDGLVSVASLMIGVGGGSSALHVMILAGLAGLVGGALSMAVGEYISVSSQRDAEMADIAKERAEQAKGPTAQAHELDELTKIYEDRGITPLLARKVAEELTAKDVIAAHARDELGIDLEELSSPLKAAVASGFAFLVGAGLPLLAGSFLHSYIKRLIAIVIVSTAGMAGFGVAGAVLGGANIYRGGGRVVIGGWIAMGITYGIGRAFGGTAT